MSLATLFLVVFVILPVAALLQLLILCMWTEYNLYRAQQVSEAQLKAFFGEDDVDDVDLETKPNILDYSGTSPN